MEIKAIKTEEDYALAISRLEEIFHAKPDTKQGDEAELLTILIEKYEDEFYPIDPPDPVEAIKFRMEQMNMPLGTRKSVIRESGNQKIRG